MEPHIFNCTLGFPIGCDPEVKLVSEDGSIRHSMPATSELLGMFENGEYKIKCHGFWDNEHRLVWLGNKIES